MFTALAIVAASIATAICAAAPEVTMRGRNVGPTFSDICGNPLTNALAAGLGL